MSLFKKDFSIDPTQAWLNTASEGAIPKCAQEALKECIEWKASPHLLTIPKFIEVQVEMKRAIGQLFSIEPHDVILGNSATYGIQIFADGLLLEENDEVLLLENDFPVDILPWLDLEKKGVKVNQVKPNNNVLTLEEVRHNINENTKVCCLPHVHSFSGYVSDIYEIGKLCQEHNIIFIVNISQSAGNIPLNISELNVDAVVCAGYKWLVGPYGVGFCWMKSSLRKKLSINRAYWTAYLSDEELSLNGPLKRKEITSARKLDMYGTANFFNYIPWKASLDYLFEVGVNNINDHNSKLVNILLNTIDQEQYEILSPKEEPRSSIFVVSHKDPKNNKEKFDQLKDGCIHGAFWKGNIRLSPHLYNSEEEVNTAVKILNEKNL